MYSGFARAIIAMLERVKCVTVPGVQLTRPSDRSTLTVRETLAPTTSFIFQEIVILLA